jgi:hypothetical protein
VNRLHAQPQLEAALFRALCGKIGNVGCQGHIFETLVRVLLEAVEIFAEFNMCGELAVRVQLAFQSVRLVG